MQSSLVGHRFRIGDDRQVPLSARDHRLAGKDLGPAQPDPTDGIRPNEAPTLRDHPDRAPDPDQIREAAVVATGEALDWGYVGVPMAVDTGPVHELLHEDAVPATDMPVGSDRHADSERARWGALRDKLDKERSK